MKLKSGMYVAVAAVALFGLSGCTSDKKSDDGGSTTMAPAATTMAPAATTMAPAAEDGAGSLSTATTAAGTVVVDGNGMAVYQFDTDTQGGTSSTCEGQCASNWPAVPGGAAAPTVDGVTGALGTITGVDGKPQLTLNGWPLYYYAGDQAAGDINGQGVGGVWWLLTPAGDPITK